jgi:hypothetical protein
MPTQHTLGKTFRVSMWRTCMSDGYSVSSLVFLKSQQLSFPSLNRFELLAYAIKGETKMNPNATENIETTKL